MLSGADNNRKGKSFELAESLLSGSGGNSELMSRIWVVIQALILYRIGSYIPIPGIDADVLRSLVNTHKDGVLGMFNMLSGGSLARMSIFALAIMPYITASIIMQLVAVVIPYIAELKKEGTKGRKKINALTSYATVLLATFQGLGLAVGLESMSNGSASLVFEPGLLFRITTVINLVTGTIFLMWLGDQVSKRGIGNGISLIIFAGIVSGLPGAIGSTFELGRTGALSYGVVLLVMLLVAVLLYGIIFIESSFRKVMVQYPRRQVGRSMYGGEASHMPLKINTAGVIPPIFAGSILLFPLTIVQFSSSAGGDVASWLESFARYFAHGHPVYMICYSLLIIFFCFFYTSMIFNVDETADNLRKNGGIVPGYRPGKRTAEYLNKVLVHVTCIGSVYLVLICVLPEIVIANYSVPFYLGGTGVLIVVNVVLDMMTQVQTYLYTHKYKHLMKKSRVLGRKKGGKKVAQ